MIARAAFFLAVAVAVVALRHYGVVDVLAWAGVDAQRAAGGLVAVFLLVELVAAVLARPDEPERVEPVIGMTAGEFVRRQAQRRRDL